MYEKTDTTFTTEQRDLFTLEIVVEIGVNAYAACGVIKCHPDFSTGRAYPDECHWREGRLVAG